jgi:hypothetical protein
LFQSDDKCAEIPHLSALPAGNLAPARNPENSQIARRRRVGRNADAPVLTAHIVSHTHWDREWYHSAALFRQRLVALIDELVAASRADRNLSFLLDGQAVLLEDYLSVRPDQIVEIGQLLKAGALEAGPWYVLADELIPAGEALLRNLLAGRRLLTRLGASAPPVLYSPDAFGHPATLPSLAAGFGAGLIILWRGFGGESFPPANAVRWRSPDGKDVLLYHLPRAGYDFGAALPPEVEGARERWQPMVAELAARDRCGVALVLNGADHHALQLERRQAIAALAAVAVQEGTARIVTSSLSGFAQALTKNASSALLPAVAGELRDSYGYTWTLQGTFASRMGLKKLLAAAERVLLGEAEPWAALARARKGISVRHLLDDAWRSVLLALPHDTICGCSIDSVAKAAAQRLTEAIEQGSELAKACIFSLAGYNPSAVREAQGSAAPRADVLLIVNPVARERGGVAELIVVQKLRDMRVGPGSARQPPPARRPAKLLALAPLHATEPYPVAVQEISASDRVDLIESPHHYPDADLVRERIVLAWVPPIPGYGFLLSRALSSAPGWSASDPPCRATAIGPRAIGNGIVEATVDGDGGVWLSAAPGGESGSRASHVRARIWFEDMGDRGDLYTPSLVGPRRLALSAARCSLVERGPLRATLACEFSTFVENSVGNMNVIAGLARNAGTTPSSRSKARRPELKLSIAVAADSPLVKLTVTGDNQLNNHRLRLMISSDVVAGESIADAPLGVVARGLDVPGTALPDEESVLRFHPIHRFITFLASHGGMTLFAADHGEYEAAAGVLAVTLLRGVGELSRHDIPERPGNAGLPARTPLAQERGQFTRSFAWMPHVASPWDTLAPGVIEAADDFLAPLRGVTLRDCIADPVVLAGLELRGKGLAFSCAKESEDGRSVVLRCINLTGRRVSGQWRAGHALQAASLARLDEKPIRRLAVTGGDRVRFSAAAHEIVTILAYTRRRSPHLRA